MTSAAQGSPVGAAPGLRARKQLRVRRELQRAAIRLVEEQGYDNTSVEDICAAAEVSRSTFFRYFGTKSAVFEADLIEESVADRWADLDDYSVATLRDLICATYRELPPDQFDQERRRIHLLQAVPELRASFASELIRPLPVLVGFVARMLDLPPHDQRVRTVAGMVFGVLATMLVPDNHGALELPVTAEEAVTLFEAVFADLEHVVDLDALRAEPRAD